MGFILYSICAKGVLNSATGKAKFQSTHSATKIPDRPFFKERALSVDLREKVYRNRGGKSWKCAPKKDRNYDLIRVLSNTAGLRTAAPTSKMPRNRPTKRWATPSAKQTASYRESWSLYLPVNERKKTLPRAHIALPCWKVRSPV